MNLSADLKEWAMDFRQSQKRSEEAPRGVCILLVEDEPAIRELVGTVLKARGWQVEVARTGREAVARWRAEKFDLVLMDVQMPEMDGLEATRRIREMETGDGEQTCIIALTAHAGQQTREACFGTGMNAFLSKPIRIGELCAAIENCLQRKGEIGLTPSG